jgi:alkylation response protein AidB-like acyl-CoA dehydrogenase
MVSTQARVGDARQLASSSACAVTTPTRRTAAEIESLKARPPAETRAPFAGASWVKHTAILVSVTASRDIASSGERFSALNLPIREDAAGAILYAAERAIQVALDAIQILGGNGYTDDDPLGRLLRDAKLYEIGAGTSEIRRMLIGRELFEKSA